MEDMKQVLDESTKLGRQINQEYPEFMKGLVAFMQAAEKEGALSKKTKELIAVALSVAKQCHYCIAFHVKEALGLGATRDEIMEAAFVACLMGGGPAFMYSKVVRKAIDDFSS